jgi:hypothetical protein
LGHEVEGERGVAAELVRFVVEVGLRDPLEVADDREEWCAALADSPDAGGGELVDGREPRPQHDVEGSGKARGDAADAVEVDQTGEEDAVGPGSEIVRGA